MEMEVETAMFTRYTRKAKHLSSPKSPSAVTPAIWTSWNIHCLTRWSFAPYIPMRLFSWSGTIDRIIQHVSRPTLMRRILNASLKSFLIFHNTLELLTHYRLGNDNDDDDHHYMYRQHFNLCHPITIASRRRSQSSYTSATTLQDSVPERTCTHNWPFLLEINV